MRTGTQKQSPLALVLRSLVAQVLGHLDAFEGPGFDPNEAQAVLTKAQRLLDRRARGDNRQWSSILQEISRLCVLGQQPWLLDVHELPRPYYNIFGSFHDNSTGPWQDSLSERPMLDLSPRSTLFGRPIACPFGLAASALSAHPTWVRFYAQRGYNLITFRTVRSHGHPVFPPPNWLFTEGFDEPLDTVLDPGQQVVGSLSAFPRHLEKFSMVNSFGMPSQGPSAWREDLQLSLKYLAPTQLLLVSVTGEMESATNVDDLAGTFEEAAASAEAAGAVGVELNLSSPNVAHGSSISKQRVDDSPEDCAEVVRRVRSRLDPQTKLIAKLGYKSYDALLPLVREIASSVDAISGINALQVSALGFNQQAARRMRAIDRSRAGLSGVALRNLALDFTESLNRLRHEGGHEFEIISMGGVMRATDAMDLYERGANAVQSATAALVDWRLSLRVSDLYRETHSTGGTRADRLSDDGIPVRRSESAPGAVSPEEEAGVDITLLDLLRRARVLTVEDFRGLTTYPLGALEASLERLLHTGAVSFDGETQSYRRVSQPKRRLLKRGTAA